MSLFGGLRSIATNKGIRAAKKAFTEWADRYKQQGYYSSSKHGKIHLLDLIDFCQFIEM